MINKSYLEYLENTKQDINEFLGKYIEVDKVIKSGYNEDSIFTIKNLINEQITRINTIPKEIHSDIDNNISSIKNLINEQITRINTIPLEVHNEINNNIISQMNYQLKNINDRTLIEIDNRFQNKNSDIEIKSAINQLSDKVTEFHNLFKNNSSAKGTMSENGFQTILNNTFPASEIIRTSKEVNSGDFIIKTHNQPDILIDLKSYSNNVPKRDREKFLKDIKLRQTHGILLSTSGIATKTDFSIDLIEEKYIILYVTNYKFDTSKLKIATEIIYSMNEHFINSQTDNIKLNRKIILKQSDKIRKYTKIKTSNSFIRKKWSK